MSEAVNGFRKHTLTASKIMAVLLVAIAMALLLNFAFLALAYAWFVISTGSINQATALLTDSITSIWFMLGTTVTQEIAWILVPAAFIVFVDRRRFAWRELGWELGPRGVKLFLAGIVLNALLGIAIVSTIFLTGWQHIAVYGIPTYGLATVAGYLALTLFLMFAVGVGEETLFRGYIQTDLMRKYGNLTALMVTSIIFAAIHIVMLIAGQEVSPLSIFNIFLASLVMGYLYVITGSICASIGFHFFQDFLAAGVFLTGELPYANQPVFLFSKAGNIVVSGISLGSSDNLVNLFWFTLLLVGLYIYDRNVRKRAAARARVQ